MNLPAESSKILSRQPQMATQVHLPFSFAKRHGVLVSGQGETGIQVICRPDVSLDALLETQRYLGSAVHCAEVGPEEFDRLLQQAYEDRSSRTMESVEGLEDDLDLDSVAQALAEPEDLIENEDDAPFIRLINALLTQAIRENASDIHIEPFESRLVVRFR
ncbi:MAG TPA: type II secretion system protein GspE, partial [Chromatiales bacterium]|nr:type II secretion system protein GspE [Chromatiales bacterium]